MRTNVKSDWQRGPLQSPLDGSYAWLPKILIPPVLETTAATRRARLLHAIVTIVVITDVVVMTLIALVQPVVVARALAAVSVILVLASIALLANKHGKTVLGTLAFICGFMVQNALHALQAGGVRSPGIQAFFILAMMAALILGERGGLLIALGCIAVTFGLALAETLQVLPVQSVVFGQWTLWALNARYVVILCAVLIFFSRTLKEALDSAQVELHEKMKTERRLEDALVIARESQERYALAISGTNDGIWEWDVRWQKMFYSPRLEELLGYAPGGLDTSLEGLRSRIHPEDRRREIAALQKHLDVGHPYDVELRLQVRDGSYRWFRSRGQALRDDAGLFSRMAGSVADITGSRALTAERERLIQDLEQKNAELERFTYTASHDLKSPLVTIKVFAGMLREDILQDNRQQVEVDVQRIARAADKMMHLLDDLLELSRIGRVVNPPVLVEMDNVVKTTLELIAAAVEERRVEVSVDPMPSVRADQRRIEEVWQNLAENAIKYMGSQENPRLHFGCRAEGSEHIFYLTDNGIGVEPRHRELIFGLFNKLDSNSEGSGIGLAIAKRIVEVHGGRIWVESTPSGHGSTFCFSLPGNTS